MHNIFNKNEIILIIRYFTNIRYNILITIKHKDVGIKHIINVFAIKRIIN